MLAVFIAHGYNEDIHPVAGQFLRKRFSNSMRASSDNFEHKFISINQSKHTDKVHICLKQIRGTICLSPGAGSGVEGIDPLFTGRML